MNSVGYILNILLIILSNIVFSTPISLILSVPLLMIILHATYMELKDRIIDIEYKQQSEKLNYIKHKGRW